MKNILSFLSIVIMAVMLLSCEKQCKIDQTAKISIENNTGNSISVKFNSSGVGSVSGNNTKAFETNAGPIFVLCTQTEGYLFTPTTWTQSVVLEACKDIEVTVN